MTNRTLKFVGKGFGDTPASIVASVNGNVVYSGEITTAPLPVSMDYTTYGPIFTAEIPVEFYGNIPVSVQITNGTIVVGETMANYNSTRNPAILEPQWAIISNPASTVEERTAAFGVNATPPFTAEEIATLNAFNESDPASVAACEAIQTAHGVSPFISTGADVFTAIYPDPEQDPKIDGIPIPVPNPQPDPNTGDWTFEAPQGTTLTFTLVIPQYGVSAGKA